MKQKIYSIMVLCVFTVFLYLFLTLYHSSLLFEDNRAIITKVEADPNFNLSLKRPSNDESFFFDTYIQKPANLELFLRASLLSADKNSDGLAKMYNRLLKNRPTWPYYFSGLAKVDLLSKKYQSNIIKLAIHYGKYERKVVYSLAELLFYRWDDMENEARLTILNYLIQQQESIISTTINISAKFAKIYQYCDYIYEQKHVEYAACKRNYWQALSD